MGNSLIEAARAQAAHTSLVRAQRYWWRGDAPSARADSRSANARELHWHTMEVTGARDVERTTPAADGVRARVPDFFIIGHEKCGTTALFQILRRHPQIFMPELKEPRFFAVDQRRPGNHPGNTLPRTLDEYLSLFTPARLGQLAGEASPQYIRSAQAARLIADVQPDARIIAVLREPTSFIRTFHLNCVRSLVESERDLRKALALEDARREGRKFPRKSRAPDRLFYRDHVRYVDQLRRYEEQFGRERMHVLIYDDFRSDNDTAIRGILRFLGLDDSVALEGWEARRVRKAVRMRRLHRMALALQRARRRPVTAGRMARAVEAATPAALRSSAVDNLLRRMIFAVPQPPDERFTLELRRRFKPEVEALSAYLERDLVREWGYQDLG
jgi:Sulfotransferase family